MCDLEATMTQHEELHNAALSELLAGCKSETDVDEHENAASGEGSGLPFDLSLADVSVSPVLLRRSLSSSL